MKTHVVVAYKQIEQAEDVASFVGSLLQDQFDKIEITTHETGPQIVVASQEMAKPIMDRIREMMGKGKEE